jgi:exodeoxyribonuclease-3
MKIATWNVNSLSVRLPQVLAWLAANPVDALCLQELKLTDDKFPHDALQAAGYEAAAFGQKTYNGVAILSRHPLRDVVRNIPGFGDEQARVIAATLDTPTGPLRLINGYFVNGQEPGSEKFAYKMRWLQALQDMVRAEMTAHPRLVLVGDFNVAPEDRDSYDPVGLRETIHHTTEERALPGPAGAGADRCLPHVRAARKKLFVVGLPDAGLSEKPGPAHRPHSGE